jgi:dienelactone hydrolase
MRRAAIVLGALFLVGALALVAVAARLRSEDPLAALPRAAPSGVTAVDGRRERSGGRIVRQVVLDAAPVGRVRLAVSLPDPTPPGRLPLVVVLGGLANGSRSLRELAELAELGPNAFVGFDWPLPSREPGVAEIVRRLPEFRRSVLSVPGQVDAIVAWAAAQPWADPDRVSLLGFSLGAFVAPGAQRLAQERGFAVRWTVLGYAGAPIGAVIAGHPKAGPAWLRPALGRATDLLLRPVEPSHHLPHLRGRFLVLGAATDRLIERGAAERFAALTPEPHEIVWVEGDHLGLGDKRKLLARVVSESRSWLEAQGAIDAIDAPAAVRGAASPEPARR